jgi:hypothetical protein
MVGRKLSSLDRKIMKPRKTTKLVTPTGMLRNLAAS